METVIFTISIFTGIIFTLLFIGAVSAYIELHTINSNPILRLHFTEYYGISPLDNFRYGLAIVWLLGMGISWITVFII